MLTILHLTTLHPRSDVRIFTKETQTLAYNFPHKVLLVVADGKGNIDNEISRVSIHDIGNISGGRVGRMFKGLWRSYLAIIRIKPDIVHFHDPELIPLGIILKVIGYKIIYDVHEDVPRQTLSKFWIPCVLRRPVAWLMSGMEWCGAKAFNVIVSATPKIADRFPAIKTVTIQNFPINNEMIRPAIVPYSERSLSFAYIGVISTSRGALEMVSSFEYLGDIPDARLDLAGEFSPRIVGDSLKALPGWVSIRYHGQVSREEVANLLSNARAGLVLFHPLPNHVDAQPNKMFEYMSAGLPVIASDFPLWRRIIDGEGCGLLVDPLNPKAIAEAIRWVLDHPAEAEAMGRRGRQAVKRTYNWDAEATKIIDLYEKLLV